MVEPPIYDGDYNLGSQAVNTSALKRPHSHATAVSHTTIFRKRNLMLGGRMTAKFALLAAVGRLTRV